MATRGVETDVKEGVMAGEELKVATSLPNNFRIAEILPHGPKPHPPAPAPSLGPLAAFVGNFHGEGFNTIFRPNSTQTPTPLPSGPAVGDNVLELNLTSETLSFSSPLGSVPNRGMVQGDAFLNGVPYLQSINDVTIAGQTTGIHLEPGLWVIVPPTTNPQEVMTLVRMASIPHGTTINAQGTARTFAGPPTIPPVSITPSFLATGGPIVFPSQTAANAHTPRIPQDLGPFIAAGTITQAMLDDPNSVLRNRLVGQHVISTTEISISTNPVVPLIGGGTDNIAFLLPNADAVQMTATFWIETIEHTIVLPTPVPNQPLHIQPKPAGPGPVAHLVPTFTLTPPHGIAAGHTIKLRSTQIQYTQTVFLNFNRLRWPHVSVATLVPAGPITAPWPP
jgi:hypothetical protein